MNDDQLPAYLTVPDIDAMVRLGLAEDVGTGDVTTLATILPDMQAEAVFLAKESGTVAGLRVVERVFSALAGPLSVNWEVSDGQQIETGQILGRLDGNARSILKGERLALNYLQRMSGIATQTHDMIVAAQGKLRVLDTRKTVPGLRLLDKWAVLLGGGGNHRVGLYDMILIKDNHIAACGGIKEAVRAARQYRVDESKPQLQIEIEIRTSEELQQLLEIGGVDRVLLDNMVAKTESGAVDVQRLQEAVECIGGQFETEASGNVTLPAIPTIAGTGVDFVSIGALTHSVKALDVSLKVTLSSDSYLGSAQPNQ